MKTLTNLFGKSSRVKNIADFNHFSLNSVQMSAIKGGVSPVVSDDALKPQVGGGYVTDEI